MSTVGDSPRHTRRRFAAPVIAFLVGAALTAGVAWSQGIQSSEARVVEVMETSGPAPAGSPTSSAPGTALPDLATAEALNDHRVRIAEEVTEGVVRLEVERTRAVAMAPVPEPFRRFFGFPGEERHREVPQTGGGSGFIVSPDGYILTNHHVIQGTEEIRVWLRDRRSFQAKLVDSDPTTDLAVIRIDAEGLPALRLGDSERVRVGEMVMAVGIPGLGATGPLEYTVTSGIVSARGRPLALLRRELRRDPRFQDLSPYAVENSLQTDAVINPGNSGGPLVTIRGEVVGVNTAIATATGFFQGYGFAIPMNLARRVMEDLVEHGEVRRPRLGIQIEDVDALDAEYYELP